MYTPPQPITPSPRPMPRPPQRKGSAIPWLFFGIMLMVILISIILVGAGALYYYSRPEIAPGVTVAGVPIGGMSEEEAAAALQSSTTGQNVLLTDGDRSWEMPLVSLGIIIDWPSTLEAATFAKQNDQVQPRYQVDLNQTQTGLVQVSEQANVPAVSGNPPQEGRALEIPVMLDRLRLHLTDELSDGVLDLSMIQVVPPPEESVNLSPDETTVHVVESGQELGLIARMYGVTVDDIIAINELDNPDLIDVGQELLIPADGVYQPSEASAPPAPTNSGKSILVSTTEQRIYAYENGELIRSHLTSTGLPETPTVLGDYKVYVKYVATDMSGPGYFLPQVPYTMYFYQGYGIHGTYWHNSFGRPMSHGCVNLPPEEAQWFFEWAEVGTPVRVV
jgi:lipoprotein-anchoring transpeptidase ErfK/SrfK